jgi:outer membrane protein
LLSVSFPIFTGGRIDADVRTAWSFLREAMLIETQTRRRVAREIDQAVRNLTASQDRINELEVQLKAATDSFNQADASYQAGLATNLERVTAQDAMLQSQLALATETIDQKVLWISLIRSCGTLRETMLDTRRTSYDLPTTTPGTAPTTQAAKAGA